MLAEIAVANAAFKVIKTAIANGQELHDVANQASDYFNSKSVITKKANKTGNKSDMEAFMALEALKEQEQHLREVMIYAGRGGMYNDWLQFQSDCKRNRLKEDQEQARKAAKNKKQLLELFTVFCTLLVAVPTIATAAYIIFSILGSI